MNKTLDKIDEYFQLACGSNGCVDLKAAFKLLWSTLNNSVSAVDLAGVFSISIPSNNPVEALSRDLFHDFLRAYSRLKFPSGGDFVERILEDLRQSKGGIHTGMNPPTSSIMKSTTNAAANAHQQQLLQQNQIHSAESNLIYSIADKTLIRVLLKYDLQLRRAYAAFCGQAVRVGGLVSWDEVKSLNLGMELDGLLSFGGAYSLLPNHFSSQQLEIIFREIIGKYSLLANNNTLHTSILFPQFQLLMVLLAHERVEIQIKKNEKIDKLFVKKPNDQRVKLLVDSLVELFKDMGIHKFDDSMSYPLQYRQQQTQFKGAQTTSEGVQLDHTLHGNDDLTMTSNALMKGQITLPLTEKKEDLYTASASNTRQIQSLRLDHLFEDLQRRLMEVINTLNTPNNTTTAATMTPFPETNLSTSKVFDIQALIHVLTNRPDEVIDTKARLPTKPVVICDALPIPVNAPDTIDQLLEAALAHHNLGSYEDSLKFLEAGKIQLYEIIESNKKRHQLSGGSANPNNNIELNYYDLRLYIFICKGNVYQSCGDDEQSLVQYLDGYHLSKEIKDYDWEIICLNSIGVLAFFNLRYDVALLCFYLVYDFRDRVYGSDSQDTATSLNNLGCCLYCLNRRGESRLKFERAWNIFAKTIGHRASRTVLVWKNLEKARRSHAAVQTKKDLKESIEMRPDADKLIMGGTFTIQAAVMAETKSKKKKGGGKKKKGK